jgi:hypothetical protein
MVPVRFKWRVTKHTHYRDQKIEYQHHQDTRPYEAQVHPRELESKEVCADGEFENRNPDEVDNLYDPQIVAVVEYIVGFGNAGIIDVPTLPILDNLPAQNCA